MVGRHPADRPYRNRSFPLGRSTRPFVLQGWTLQPSPCVSSILQSRKESPGEGKRRRRKGRSGWAPWLRERSRNKRERSCNERERSRNERERAQRLWERSQTDRGSSPSVWVRSRDDWERSLSHWERSQRRRGRSVAFLGRCFVFLPRKISGGPSGRKNRRRPWPI
jgi:hypothetical protein